MPKVLTQNQIDGYQRDGLLFPLPALSTAEVRYFRACHDEMDRLLGGQGTAQQKGDAHLYFKWICDLATHGDVLDAVQDIIGPDILIHSSTIFTKYAHDQKFVSWHQDSHYWGLSEPRLVSAWIALTDSTIDNGCLRVLPGTHTKPFAHVESPEAANILSRGTTVSEVPDVDEAVDVVLRAGQMSFHHANLIHGSKPNASADPRIGVAVRYAATAVKQRKPHIPVILARGRDEYHHYRLQERPNAGIEAGIRLSAAQTVKR